MPIAHFEQSLLFVLFRRRNLNRRRLRFQIPQSELNPGKVMLKNHGVIKYFISVAERAVERTAFPILTDPADWIKVVFALAAPGSVPSRVQCQQHSSIFRIRCPFAKLINLVLDGKPLASKDFI